MRTDTPTLTCASDTEDRASSPNTSTRHCKKYALRIIVTSRVTRTDEHERKNCCGWAPTLMIVNPPADGKLLGRLLHNEYVTVGAGARLDAQPSRKRPTARSPIATLCASATPKHGRRASIARGLLVARTCASGDRENARGSNS